MSQTDLLTDVNQPEEMRADNGTRFLHYLIDVVVFYAVIFLFGIVLGTFAADFILSTETDAGASLLLNVISISLFVLYFGMLEGATKGRTVGKLITKTKAIREDGSPITYGDAFKRTLIRLIPFEPFSAFFSDGMWHDKWSKTMVVKMNN